MGDLRDSQIKAIKEHADVFRIYNVRYSYLDSTISFFCKVCNKWYEYGHETDCPLKEVKE